MMHMLIVKAIHTYTHSQPRLRDFCHFIEWSNQVAPNLVPQGARDDSIHSAGEGQGVRDDDHDVYGDALLGRMENEMPALHDEQGALSRAMIEAAEVHVRT
jgi:hypothetical protein